MKSKILVSLLVALVMLFTLAAPALAGRPIAVSMIKGTESLGAVEYKLQVAHDNNIKLTFVTEGVPYLRTYHVWVWDDTEGYYDWYNGGLFQITRENGNVRARIQIEYNESGTHNLRVFLTNNSVEHPTYPFDSTEYFWLGNANDVYFK